MGELREMRKTRGSLQPNPKPEILRPKPVFPWDVLMQGLVNWDAVVAKGCGRI